MAERYTVAVGATQHVIMRDGVFVAGVPFNGHIEAAHSLALKMAAAEEMYEALVAAAEQFASYAQQHQVKADEAEFAVDVVATDEETRQHFRSEQEARQRKADTNKRFAALCNDALRLSRGEPQ
jgi:hypothetical protein